MREKIVKKKGKGMKKQIIIKVDWRSLESIQQAEKAKTRAEDKGYILEDTMQGFQEQWLVYRRA